MDAVASYLGYCNKAAMNVGGMHSFKINVFIFFKFMGVELLGHMGSSIFSFLEEAQCCFLQCLHQFTFPPISTDSLFSTFFPTFVVL